MPDEVRDGESVDPRGVGLKVALRFLLGEAISIGGFRSRPEACRDAERSLKLDGCLRRDCGLAVDDLVDRLERTCHAARQLGLSHAAVTSKTAIQLERT